MVSTHTTAITWRRSQSPVQTYVLMTVLYSPKYATISFQDSNFDSKAFIYVLRAWFRSWSWATSRWCRRVKVRNGKKIYSSNENAWQEYSHSCDNGPVPATSLVRSLWAPYQDTPEKATVSYSTIFHCYFLARYADMTSNYRISPCLGVSLGQHDHWQKLRTMCPSSRPPLFLMLISAQPWNDWAELNKWRYIARQRAITYWLCPSQAT
jgi:hypothetical protein